MGYDTLYSGEIRYTDNCICDIPMDNKNDLNDKVGIHNFKVSITGLYNNFYEDWTDIELYLNTYKYLSENGSSTSIRKTASTIYSKMIGETLIDNVATDFREIVNQHGIAVPSSGAYSYGIGTSATLVSPANWTTAYKYGSSTASRVLLTPNPINLVNPKTGIAYDTLTFKMKFYYANSHMLFTTHYNSNFKCSNVSDCEYVTVKFVDNFNLILRTWIANTGTNYAWYTREDYVLPTTKSVFRGYWYNVTYTMYKNAGGDSTKGGYYKAYLENRDNYAYINGEVCTKETYPGKASLGTIATYTNTYQCFRPGSNFTLVGNNKPEADVDRASYNKNFIKDLQIFAGEEYDQVATYPEIYYFGKESKNTSRVIIDNNEERNKRRRCYEYR